MHMSSGKSTVAKLFEKGSGNAPCFSAWITSKHINAHCKPLYIRVLQLSPRRLHWGGRIPASSPPAESGQQSRHWTVPRAGFFPRFCAA